MLNKWEKDKLKRFQYLYLILSLIVLLFWLFLIYGMSAKTGEESSGLSYEIAEFAYGLSVFHYLFQFDTFHLLIRKTAHFTEYGILSLLIMNFLHSCRVIVRSGNSNGINRKSVINRYFMIGTIIFCVAYASLDEYHQSFVDGRGPSVRDVCIDTLGACVFLAVFCLCRKLLAKHSLNRNSKAHES